MIGSPTCCIAYTNLTRYASQFNVKIYKFLLTGAYMNNYLKKSILTALSIAAFAASFPNLAVAADASRTTELGTVPVPGDIPQLPYEEPDYGFGEYEGWDVPDGGDEGGDFAGVVGEAQAGEAKEPMVCNIFRDAAPAGCDLKNPPPPITNGCGAQGGIDVPDSFIYGDVDFKPACNSHDDCYGTAGSGKASCDLQLEAEMESQCLQRYPDTLQAVQRNLCYTQANEYYVVLASGIGSDGAYASAQVGGTCRKAAQDYAAAGCTR
jgi:hypothetical protein